MVPGSSSSDESVEYEDSCASCKICGCADGTMWECEADGIDCSRSDVYYSENAWVGPMLEEPFRHCHNPTTFHVYGKLKKDHVSFPIFWNSFAQVKKDDLQPKRCPQCQNADIHISSHVFRRGYFDIQSFKCFVCPEGCVSCYVIYPVIQTKHLSKAFFVCLNAISRVDLSASDTVLKRKRDGVTHL